MVPDNVKAAKALVNNEFAQTTNVFCDTLVGDIEALGQLYFRALELQHATNVLVSTIEEHLK